MLDLASPPKSALAGLNPDFKSLLDNAGWLRLRPDIRRRFSAPPDAGREIRYSGVMQAVEASLAGRILVQLCRVFGTPFAPFRGRNVPVDIVLRSREGDGAIQWEREYRFHDRTPIKVSSFKTKSAEGDLREWVDGGFGMSLDVYEEDEALHFRSRRYFWRHGRLQIALPAFLTPGTVHVVHEDIGGGRFRFVMTVVHGLFGQLFFQTGEFSPAGGEE
jgi:hypothetical protein